MSRFIADFAIDNAAFEENACSSEVARILRVLADKIEGEVPVGYLENDGERIPLRDINGNTVGFARVEED